MALGELTLDFVAIAGPTGSGKSAVALRIAEALSGEIVSCDSQDVYRRLDVGTAKPTPAECARVPHHLIDVCEPTSQMSAGDYVRLADAAIQDIRKRGQLPIVAGGTGLWLRALLFGMIDVPESSPEIRAELETKLAAAGPHALFEELRAIDDRAAAAIEKSGGAANAVRIIRALELFRLTGRRPSELWESHRFQKPRYAARVFALNPPRDVLYQRINARTRAMFTEGGLLDEVRVLVADGLADAPAVRRAIGYPQAAAVLSGKMSLEAAIEETAKLSRHYAKRQWTWFRAEKSVEWLNAFEADSAAAEILERLKIKLDVF